jgi:hypothetical protein
MLGGQSGQREDRKADSESQKPNEFFSEKRGNPTYRFAKLQLSGERAPCTEKSERLVLWLVRWNR